MKVNQLKIYLAVAEEGSIHSGARRIGISQPAVSTTIRHLEEHFGVPLMSRAVRGIELTEFGELLLTRGRALLSDLNRLDDEMKHLALGKTGSVAVAVSTATACALLPRAFQRFRATLPYVDVNLRDATYAHALTALREGSVDFALMHVLPSFQCPDDISRQFLSAMPYVIGVRASHPLAAVRSVADLVDADWLLPPSSDSIPGTLFQQVFVANGLPQPKCLTHCDSIAAALNLFAEMDVVGFFSKPLADVEFERFGLTAVPVRETLPSLHAVLLTRKTAINSVVSQHFMQCFVPDAEGGK
ncbi:LysR family transcriptional regulator [Sphingomonas sp. BT-65]|uniref:LysR family transcriptional regulator n=1 Tax=Sphingomonas sp. BT-65 TaxID=2989821 RepID=UPI00223680DD|nr:LysR family transcriptional regulator [Sphingomonas sp. BT-65]MCW4460914.1 LysR family transcriptional regulator [Sphingomonas sp. BT-65]